MQKMQPSEDAALVGSMAARAVSDLRVSRAFGILSLWCFIHRSQPPSLSACNLLCSSAVKPGPAPPLAPNPPAPLFSPVSRHRATRPRNVDLSTKLQLDSFKQDSNIGIRLLKRFSPAWSSCPGPLANKVVEAPRRGSELVRTLRGAAQADAKRV